MIILVFCLVIFVLTFLLMVTSFVLAVRFGMFENAEYDSIKWNDFKKYFTLKEFKKLITDKK